MARERTLSIIKPDATDRNIVGKIITYFEQAGLAVTAIKRLRLTREEAALFYAVHRERAFFGELIDFMVSGPVVVMVLEGEDAVAQNRAIMGATDPKKAEKGTIRADLATSIEANAVHGSDSVENALQEISFFFAKKDIIR